MGAFFGLLQRHGRKNKSGGCKGDKAAAALEVFFVLVLLACNCNISKRAAGWLHENARKVAKKA